MATRKQVENFAERHGLKLYHSYSGRGMYGKTCLGCIVPQWGETEGIRKDLKRLKGYKDALGFDTIVYWPSVAE